MTATAAATAPASPSAAAVERITIPVSGMTCAACQGRVQRALARTPGVVDAAVNLMTNNATVSYDPAKVTMGSLIDAVSDAGYEAQEASSA